MKKEPKPRGRPSKYTPELAEIYALCDPATGEVRYIGKANNTIKRLAGHIRDARRRNTPVYCWIRSLMTDGRVPVARQIASAWDWKEMEKACISQYRNDGARLLNLADGGDQPSNTPEQRSESGARLNAYLLANPYEKMLQDLKRRIANGLRNGHVSESAKAKLRLAAKRNPGRFGAWATI